MRAFAALVLAVATLSVVPAAQAITDAGDPVTVTVWGGVQCAQGGCVVEDYCIRVNDNPPAPQTWGLANLCTQVL